MSAAYWELLLLLLLVVVVGLAHANHSESTCVCDDHLDTVCVKAGANVTVPCLDRDNLTKKWDEMGFNLYRGPKRVHDLKCNFSTDTPRCEPHSSGGVELNLNNKSIFFTLSAVDADSHGLYRCEAIPIWPPPLMAVKRAAVVLVLLEGHQCKVEEAPNIPEPYGGQWKIWIAVLVSLILYSIFISIFACVTRVRLRKAECQTDYMNTKPKATRRKRGVQIPIPRHF